MMYWDASALVPLLVQEQDTRRREKALRRDGDIVTGWGSRLECASALNRLGRENALSADGLEQALDGLRELADGWTEVQASPAVQDRALRLLRVHTLRAADAAQLAAALIAVGDAPRDVLFQCADERLSLAARKEGFHVE